MKTKKVVRWIIGTIIALIVLYLIAWFIGRYWLESHYNKLLETAEQRGVTVQAQDIQWGGFPFGYRLTWSQPTVTFDQSQASFQIKATGQDLNVEWFPWRGFYFTWHSKGTTKVEVKLLQQPTRIFLNEGGWHGFISFNEPKPSFSVTFNKLGVEGIIDQILHFDQLSISWLLTRPALDVNPDYFNYKAELDIKGWQIPEIIESTDPVITNLVKTLGNQVQDFNIHLTFPEPWVEDGHFIKSWQKDQSPLTIDTLDIKWGAFKAHADGQIFLDSEGKIMPDVAIETENSGQIIKVVAEQPFIDKQTATLLRLAGPVVLRKVRLISEGDTLYLGPVPLGPLPHLPTEFKE